MLLPRRLRLPRTRQADREFGEFALAAVDGNRAAMLLGDDVIADRETEPRAFPRRLGGEKRLEQLLFDLRRDAGAVVADTDLDTGPEVARRHLEGRPECLLVRLLATLVGGVEAVAEQVQEYPCDILRHHIERARLRSRSRSSAMLKFWS